MCLAHLRNLPFTRFYSKRLIAETADSTFEPLLMGPQSTRSSHCLTSKLSGFVQLYRTVLERSVRGDLDTDRSDDSVAYWLEEKFLILAVRNSDRERFLCI